ncbi:hypothetical protein GCM10022216_32580 [Sphingobacterium kyonggiense]|uniref:DUF3024 family protein n=1 Tax=Sphingobacterium kyonggiense TaxID=714075 RepID=A0ABP7Z449_9SPHI
MPTLTPEDQIKNFVEQKRPKDLEIRKQIDLGYSWDGRTAIFFEIRPHWNDPSIIRENPIAKIVFIKTTQIWKLYWMRSTGKWESYMPKKEAKTIKTLLSAIQEDKFRLFFG